jgi:hypothetical protein
VGPWLIYLPLTIKNQDLTPFYFDLTEGQAGAVFMINGRVAGMDCFGKSETFSKVFKKLVESYALDAIDSLRKDGEKELESNKSDAGKFLEAAVGCRVEAHQSVGLGIDCRLDTDQSSGCAPWPTKKRSCTCPCSQRQLKPMRNSPAPE